MIPNLDEFALFLIGFQSVDVYLMKKREKSTSIKWRAIILCRKSGEKQLIFVLMWLNVKRCFATNAGCLWLFLIYSLNSNAPHFSPQKISSSSFSR